MLPHNPSYANNILFFNDSAPQNYRDNAHSIFSQTWEKIPPSDQKNIEGHLELIIVKPINDPLHPNTVAFARASPIVPTWFSWIVWDPCFSFFQKQSRIFLLAHEFAHVILLHPQKEDSKDKAEKEANHLVLKVWKILPSVDDKELFPNFDL